MNKKSGISKMFSIIGIGKFGFFEMIFALYLILAGYAYGSIRLDFYTLLFLDIVALIKGYRFVRNPKILYFLVVYVIIHEIFVYLMLPDHPSYLFHSIISYIVVLFSIFIIYPALRKEELHSALYIVGFISAIGLFYHFFEIMNGHIVTPLKLPFLPTPPSSSSRFFEGSVRPKSFYAEPEACITFLLVPLFLSLKDKKYALAFFYFFSIFLSTSTTGILLSSITIFVYALSQKSKLYIKLLSLSMIFIMFYMLINGGIFASGLEKIEQTNVEENNRIVAGYNFVSNMDLSYFPFGIPYANAYDCAVSTGMNANGLFIDSKNELFISTIWNVLIKLGFVGVILFILLYRYYLIASKELWPFLIPCIVGFFAQGSFFGAVFVFQTIFILCEIKWSKTPLDKI